MMRVNELVKYWCDAQESVYGSQRKHSADIPTRCDTVGVSTLVPLVNCDGMVYHLGQLHVTWLFRGTAPFDTHYNNNNKLILRKLQFPVLRLINSCIVCDI